MSTYNKTFKIGRRLNGTKGTLQMSLKELFCKYCGRFLPNKTFITRNGCIWCDSQEIIKLKKAENEKINKR
jgi:hypothetical protein